MNYYEEFKQICESTYDFIVDTGSQLLFGIGISVVEVILPFMLISIIHKRDSARAFVQGMQNSARLTAFTSELYWGEENLLQKVLIYVTKIRLLFGGSLWFLGFISFTNALLIVLSALVTTIWVSAICLIGILLETRQEHVVDAVNAFIQMRPVVPPVPPVPHVERIEEPVLVAYVNPEDFEGIDYVEWTNGESAWAINGDQRHLIRQENLDRLLATPLPRNPYTQEPIIMVQRAIVNVLIPLEPAVPPAVLVD